MTYCKVWSDGEFYQKLNTRLKIDYYEYNTKIFITFEKIYKDKLWLFEKPIYNFSSFIYLHKKNGIVFKR